MCVLSVSMQWVCCQCAISVYFYVCRDFIVIRAKSSLCDIETQNNTVDSDTFARTLFSRIALKDIFVILKNRD